MQKFYLLLSLIFILGCSQTVVPSLQISEQRIEYMENPLGVDESQPRFSWVIESEQRNLMQTGYRVLVASSMENIRENRGDIWDSRMRDDPESLNIVYDGKPLKPGKRYYWKVRIRDNHGQVSEYSDSAWWETGLFERQNWQANWIGSGITTPEKTAEFYDVHPAPLLRKEFNAENRVVRGRLYISGLGYYEAYLNGQRIGDQVLDPAWTDYENRVFYSVYDVTEDIRNGRNAMGVMLGNGWYNPLPLKLFGRFNLREHLPHGQPMAISRLVIDYADGQQQVIVSDDSWCWSEGPILKNNVYLGERYDARREQPGWTEPGFNDSNWHSVQTVEGPAGNLIAQPLPPIKATRILNPVQVTEVAPDTFLFDFGQNFAGWVRLRVSGASGTLVKMRYGELVYPDGSLNPMTSVTGQIKAGGADGGPGAPETAWQEDEYILKGEGQELYTPRFTFRGFRYVEVTGFPGTPDIETLQGIRLNTDLEPAGTFQCSNQMFNKIQEMVEWTFLSNVFGVQSDCPHREKFGYGGDLVTTSEAYIYNYNMANFYEKTVRDFADAARSNGGMTECAPHNGIQARGLGGGTGPIGWQLAHPFLQAKLYQFYGDKRIIDEQYTATKRLVDFLHDQAGDGLINIGISDHSSIAKKPEALTSAAFYYHHVELLSQFAQLLGRRTDSEKYSTLAAAIQKKFNRKFLDTETGYYDNGTQACQVVPLYYDLVPDAHREAVIDVLKQNILQKQKGHLTTGIFGTKMLFDVMRFSGNEEIAYQIANQKSFPGWGYMLASGSTTLWENWRYSDNVYSHNHPMFGSISEWFYRSLVGINPAPDASGFDKIIISPAIIEDLEWVKGSYRSIRGEITSHWSKQNGALLLNLSIPANTTATVFLPAVSIDQIFEGGVSVADNEDISVRASGERGFAIEIGSGEYSFRSVDYRE